MKTLYLIRHAKSSWDDLGLKDFDRPLTDTGINKTKKIIQYLDQKKISPELIISSSAVRALETAKLIAEGVGYPVEKILTEQALYDSSVNDYLYVIENIPDDVSSVMIFGHNPTITYTANYFLKKAIDLLPTSGVVSVSFKTDHWMKIKETRPKGEFVIFPKMLRP